MRETIKEFPNQRIIGYIETEYNGDKTVRNFNNQILGYYRSDRNVTTDFLGRTLYFGDMASALLILKR